ncbi:Hsp70 family protein [Roseibium sp. CAU 1637]|uniref:Hsp70 family protein n=1 Tax=Roseibium limicola TaxID=2816037 RepID=A0A939EMT0_9HYPH|nr:Hsp70 family protein [Roseibium limicola]MBO0345595.1 Hsp70 family protein [Roseibium limicola]
MSRSFGLDFGTSNTVLAQSGTTETVERVTFGNGDDSHDGIASILSFLRPDAFQTPVPEVGPWAIRQFIEHMGDVRFIQSLKSFVASGQFKGTGVFGKRYDFEGLMSTLLGTAFAKTCVEEELKGSRIVVGRPVIFAGSAPNEQLAMERYRKALATFGFSDVHFVYEPVAAAFSFAQRLERDATVLVADFGGGTSDYSIMRFSRHGGVLQAEPVSRGGIGIAGDTFDYRIIDKVVLPELGKGSHYASMGKTLEVPPNLFSNFARWHQLSFFKQSQDFAELKKLLRYCEDDDKIELFIELVEEDQGYPLYKAVSDVKAQLSFEETVELRFAPIGRDFAVTVERADFDTWIAGDLARMDKALDDTIARANIADTDIDQVFLTGGTSFVPAVRSMFAHRFGADKITGGEELSSIANGLALIGARGDAERWAAS